MTTQQHHLTNPLEQLSPAAKFGLSLAVNAAVAAAVWWLSVNELVAPAVLIVLLAELWPVKNTPSWKLLGPRTPQLVIGISTVLIIAMLPKFISQVAVAALYLAWRLFEKYWRYDGRGGLFKLLLVQMILLEAGFLLSAVWQAPAIIVMILIWLAGTATVWRALDERAEPAAGILAATWGIMLAELSWIFLIWLVSYIPVAGSYIIIPQPVLVLSAVGYCCGSIYLAQRKGQLNRSRLTEYLLMGLILIWIIIAGTAWRGTL